MLLEDNAVILEGLSSHGDVVHLITLQHGAGLVNV